MQDAVQQICTFLSSSLRPSMPRVGLWIHQIDRIVRSDSRHSQNRGGERRRETDILDRKGGSESSLWANIEIGDARQKWAKCFEHRANVPTSIRLRATSRIVWLQFDVAAYAKAWRHHSGNAASIYLIIGIVLIDNIDCLDFLTSQIIDLATGPAIITIDKSHLQQTTLQCRRVLMDQPQHRMPVRQFVQQYSQYYMKQCNLDEFKKNLTNVVRVCIKFNAGATDYYLSAVKMPRSIETGWLNILKNLGHFLLHIKSTYFSLQC